MSKLNNFVCGSVFMISGLVALIGLVAITVINFGGQLWDKIPPSSIRRALETVGFYALTVTFALIYLLWGLYSILSHRILRIAAR
ncbi:hypothetical protein HY933_03170 [Candidatus Falkowbacteria bacterium]|nr:hypothetical protein [Candidatus Falkowbacteria bacterium]